MWAKPSAKSFGLKPSATEAEAECQKTLAFGGPLVQGATFRIKALIKSSLSLISKFEVTKTTHKGIV